MANEKSFERRVSLSLPRERIDPPNAAMVDGTCVPKSLTQHQLQRDQETETVQEREKKLNLQRDSLFTAIKIVEQFHRTNSTNEIHKFYTNVKSKNQGGTN